ncbi:nuclear transport factor 2 family protein [Sphingoaurantiacus capsulatus]|uniref:Nuclear transport factor 2 family protein n=1 Tax=Sphingoaurantiacus capsulatus TaxID=1771310 RepID=A0ABV7X5W5_9SPHN
MRAFAIAALLLVAAPVAAMPADLVAFADAFDKAQLAKNGAALDAMVSDELVFIDGSGQRLGKAAFIAGWTGPDEAFDPITLTDRTMTPLGPDAFVTSAETVLTGTSAGSRFTSRIRFSDTFRKEDGQWRAVHIQVTRLK